MQLQCCLAIWVLLLPAILPPCRASSFVYEDILAYPRYRVVLSEKKIPESTAFGHAAAASSPEADHEVSLAVYLFPVDLGSCRPTCPHRISTQRLMSRLMSRKS